MITIIGTGHIFDLSAKIHHLVSELNPDLVAVELDPARHKILELERRGIIDKKNMNVGIGTIFKPSPTPFRFRLLAYFQRKLAAANNVFPGEEMLSAIDAARSVNSKIALIDRDVRKTLASFNQSMGFREKFKFYFALLTGFSGFGLKKESMGKQVERIEKDYDSVILDIGNQFPGLKKALIDERDLNMANALTKLGESFDRIVAFVGDAHVEGMRRILAKRDIIAAVVHLNSLLGNGMGQRTDSINFSVN